MELAVKFTVTELELLEALLKAKYQQLKNNEEKEGDLLDIYKKLYADSLRRIRNVLYQLQDEPKGIFTKKHPAVSLEGNKYQMLHEKATTGKNQ
jgi:hypothetical protein